MAKHKGQEQRRKGADQRQQGGGQNRDAGRQQDGAVHNKGAQQARQHGQETDKPRTGEQSR